jgi:hypothetical protein
MNRLNVIYLINPSWNQQIREFLTEHPDFNKLIPIVALDEYPCGFNKNPHESDDDAPRNIFETVLYGISHSSLSVEDGKKHYLEVIAFFRETNVIQKDMEFPFDTTSKKLNTYREFVNKLLENNIVINEMKYSDIHLAEEISGIGDSTIDLVHLLYANTDDECVIPYTEPHFIKGMEMFFEITDITYEQMKEITSTWKNKKVGLMFIIQYAYYSNFI